MSRQIRRLGRFACVALMIVMAAATVADAQQRGRFGRGGFGRGGFGGGPGMDLLGLLRIEEVQKELELLEDQDAEIRQVAEATRGERPNFNFGELSDEQRREAFAEMQKQRETQAKAAEEKLAVILLPHQMDRLKQIQLQAAGAAALQRPEVVTALALTADQQSKIAQVVEENAASMREQMQSLFQDGNQEGMREKIAELRTAADAKVLAVLTESQQQKFGEMKGTPFDLPPQRGFGGRGGRGGRGAGGGRRQPGE